MKSKMHVRSITISNEARNRVLFEGTWELEEVAFHWRQHARGEGDPTGSSWWNWGRERLRS
jgi:hypothetical protein